MFLLVSANFFSTNLFLLLLLASYMKCDGVSMDNVLAALAKMSRKRKYLQRQEVYNVISTTIKTITQQVGSRVFSSGLASWCQCVQNIAYYKSSYIYPKSQCWFISGCVRVELNIKPLFAMWLTDIYFLPTNRGQYKNIRLFKEGAPDLHK